MLPEVNVRALSVLGTLLPGIIVATIMGAVSIAIAAAFFAIIGQPPLATLADMVSFAVGDAYSLSETLVKTIPILLCALATLLPARLGLVSVGADGQLLAGAICGTAVVLAFTGAPAVVLMPLMLLAGMAGGLAWGAVPGLLRARLAVNETITTLLLNYVAALLVSALVYGPWKAASNLGWPATIAFPPTATLPGFLGTRVHAGLLLGIGAAIVLAFLLQRTRWGIELAVLKGNAKVGGVIGLSFPRQTVLVMALGGALAGLAGVCEISAIQGRLQPNISAGFGLTGFLVAWLSGHRPLLVIPISFLIGALLAAGDALQLFAKIPSASTIILQGLLFAAALAVSGLRGRLPAANPRGA